MNRSILAALGIVAACVLVTGGCSKHDLAVAPNLQRTGGGAAQDTTPNPHPTPPPDTTIIPLQFLSADSTRVGTTGLSRWLLGNAGKKPVTAFWYLTADPSWPGFPIQGTQRIGPSRTVTLSVGVPVPASAFSGLYTLRMAMSTTPTDTFVAYGTMRVFGNEPPPSPPPQPAVAFAGSDSVVAGSTGHSAWQLFNESAHAFTMSWTLQAGSSWPGFPKQGTVDLGPSEQQLLVVDVPVPDSAAAGLRSLEMVVTRPDSLPPASSPGWIWVLPLP